MINARQAITRAYSFGGRATRAEFWLVAIATKALAAALVLSPIARGTTFPTLSPGDEWAIGGLLVLVWLLPFLAVTARRLHDLGYSIAWTWAWVALPVVGTGIGSVFPPVSFVIAGLSLAGFIVLAFKSGATASPSPHPTLPKWAMPTLLVIPATATFLAFLLLRLGPVEATYQHLVGPPVTGRLVLEMDTQDLIKGWLDSTAVQLPRNLREHRVVAVAKTEPDGSIRIRPPSPSLRDLVDRVLASMDPVDKYGPWEVTATSDAVLARPSATAIAIRTKLAMDSVIFQMRDRLASLGVWGPHIERDGEKRLIVRIPGVDDLGPIKEAITSRGALAFHPVKRQLTEKSRYVLPADQAFLKMPASDDYVLVSKEAIFSDRDIARAYVGRDHGTGQQIVVFYLSHAGARQFGSFTMKNVGESVAIVIDGKLVSTSVIREPLLGGSGQIVGVSGQGAVILAAQLRSGSLPAPFRVLEETVVRSSSQ